MSWARSMMAGAWRCRLFPSSAARWSVARALELRNLLEKLIDLAKTRPGPNGRKTAIDDDEIAARLATLRAEIAAVQAMNYETISRNVEAAQSPGPEASMDFLYWWGNPATRPAAVARHSRRRMPWKPSGDAEEWTALYLRRFAII